MRRTSETVFTLLTDIIEAVFPAMMLGFILPVVYLSSDGRADSFMLPLYLAGFILVLPAGVGKHFLRKVKNFGTWLLISAALIAGSYLLAVLIAKALPFGSVYAAAQAASMNDENLNVFTVSPKILSVAIAVEAAVILFDYYLVRMEEASRIRAARENDLGWTSRTFIFDTPSPAGLLWFLVVYVLALLFTCKTLADIAAAALIVYAVMLLFYRYAADTAHYLRRLDYISSMPGRRIRKIGAVLTITILIAAAVFAFIAGGLSSRARMYGDLRHFKGTGIITQEDMEQLQQSMPENLFVPPDEIQPTEEWKYAWVFQAVSYAVLALCAFLGIRAVIRMLRGIFDEFRDAEDENGDISITLENGDLAERLTKRKAERYADSPRERIRREYRRAIRKARKELPHASETPTEIEIEAGLADNAAMQDLHVRYEEARYGRGV